MYVGIRFHNKIHLYEWLIYSEISAAEDIPGCLRPVYCQQHCFLPCWSLGARKANQGIFSGRIMPGSP